MTLAKFRIKYIDRLYSEITLETTICAVSDSAAIAWWNRNNQGTTVVSCLKIEDQPTLFPL